MVAAAVVIAGCSDGGEVGTDSDAGTEDATTVEEVQTVPLPEPVQVLEIEGGEYVFDISPDTSEGLRPGWTEVRFDNVGEEPHQVMFARVKDGVDMAELAAAGAGDSSGAAAIEFVDMIGGISYIAAGNDTTALVDLPEGLVMVMCYVPDSDGVAHALMGMTASLNVSATASPIAEPATSSPGDGEVVGTIGMSADGYEFPDRIEPGWYHVDNTDEALHELSLLRMDRAVDAAELDRAVKALAANRLPDVGVEAVGGLAGISAGFDGYLYLDLEPGEYMAVDFMPDPGDPRPHMLDGYYGSFTVEDG